MQDTSLLFHELHQSVRLLSKVMNERLQNHGLYQSQWSILYCLNRFGTMTQTEIWKYMNVEAPTITRTLTRLEKNGWVIRRKGKDQRERIVMLTEKARKEIPAIVETVEKFEREMLENLTPQEQEHLYRLLRLVGASTMREEGQHE